MEQRLGAFPPSGDGSYLVLAGIHFSPLNNYTLFFFSCVSWFSWGSTVKRRRERGTSQGRSGLTTLWLPPPAALRTSWLSANCLLAIPASMAQLTASGISFGCGRGPRRVNLCSIRGEPFEPVNAFNQTTPEPDAPVPLLQYQLLDFGGGRKLERFGTCLFDRPAPTATGVQKASPDLWHAADACFVGSRRKAELGSWKWAGSPKGSWTVSYGPLVFELKTGGFGQVGLFPEQAANWGWLDAKLARADRPARILNLFAYTGGSSLAAAAAGAEVVHVDAARSEVQRARRNAELSGLASAPIRWIVEDARKFVARERRRRNQYDAIILDPPSYGHGPQGESWKIERHLPDLLDECARLTEDRRTFVLLTCHSAGLGSEQLRQLLRRAFGGEQRQITASTLNLTADDGRLLFGGEMACWVP